MLHDDQVQVGAGGPEAIVGGAEQRRDIAVGRHGRDEHAGEPGLGRPPGVGDRVLDVVQEHLGQPDASTRQPVAPVDQPSVVGPDARQSPSVIVAVAGWAGDELTRREERRDGVGEDDLGRDPLRLEFTVADLVVPVADLGAVLQITERVGVRLPPLGVGVPVGRVEVLGVVVTAAAGVTIGRDDRVATVDDAGTGGPGRVGGHG